MVILRPEETGLKELLERTIDKGVAIDANVRIQLGGIDLLTTKARIVLASFKIADRVGLDFPKGVNLNTPAWRDLKTKQSCPVCGKESPVDVLQEEGCPWCGWNYGSKEK